MLSLFGHARSASIARAKSPSTARHVKETRQGLSAVNRLHNGAIHGEGVVWDDLVQLTLQNVCHFGGGGGGCG